MSKTVEIELRYEVIDEAQLTHFLTRAQLLGKKHDVDVYLDTSDHVLWQRGVFVRLRNDKGLDIKFNRACLDDATIDRLDYCEEHRFALPLAHSDLQRLNNLLVSLGLRTIMRAELALFKVANQFETHYIVDKVRTSYLLDGFTIAVDEVVGLGTFLEIELMAATAADLESVKNAMHATLSGLQLQPLRLGYCSMVLKKQDFACYCRGRYAAPVDRQS